MYDRIHKHQAVPTSNSYTTRSIIIIHLSDIILYYTYQEPWPEKPLTVTVPSSCWE